MRLLFLCLLLFQPVYAKKYHHEVAIAAIFQNEAPWLKEWIEYHQLIGVEHFYLYNNLSQDQYKEVLSPYIQKKIVTLIEWPYKYTYLQGWVDVQLSAYKDALARTRKKVHWLAVIDIDEFIVPMNKELPQLLKEYEKYGGLAVHWQAFGTSSVKKIPDDKLMIETLLMRAERHDEENQHIKSIVQPHRVESFPNPHFAHYKKNYFQVNTRKQPVSGPKNTIWDLDILRIHHYWTRDEDFFFRVKCPSRQKRRPHLTMAFFLKQLEALNKVEDKTMLRFTDKIRKSVRE